MLTLDPLYSIDKKGKIRVWTVKVTKNYTITEYGCLDGKIVKTKREHQAMNVGKENETTPEEQAILEAERKWEFKIKQNYTTKIPTKKDIENVNQLKYVEITEPVEEESKEE